MMFSKNYTTHTNENEISTHEETLSFTRASLRSVEKHRFNRKMFSLRSPSFFGTHFSQIGFADFVKPLIKRKEAKGE